MMSVSLVLVGVVVGYFFFYDDTLCIVGVALPFLIGSLFKPGSLTLICLAVVAAHKPATQSLHSPDNFNVIIHAGPT